MEFVGLRNFRRLLFAREGGDAVLGVFSPNFVSVHDEHNGVTDVNVPLDSEDPTGTRCQSGPKRRNRWWSGRDCGY